MSEFGLASRLRQETNLSMFFQHLLLWWRNRMAMKFGQWRILHFSAL